MPFLHYLPVQATADSIPDSLLTDQVRHINLVADSTISTICSGGGSYKITAAGSNTLIPFGDYDQITDLPAGDLLCAYKSDVSAVASPGDELCRIYLSDDGTTTDDKPGTVSEYEFFGVPGDYSGDVLQDWVTGDTYAGSGGLSTADLVAGPLGYALTYITSGTDYVNVGRASGLLFTSALTIELVAKPINSNDSAPVCFIESGGAGWAITTNGSNEWQGTARGGSGLNTQTATTLVDTSNFQHISYSWSGSDGSRIYYNGVDEANAASNSSLAIPTSPLGFTIGTRNDAIGALNYGGQIGDVRISSVVRSADAINDSYLDSLDNAAQYTIGTPVEVFTEYKRILFDAAGIPDSALYDYPKLIVIEDDADIAAECTASPGIRITDGEFVTIHDFGLYPNTDLSTGNLTFRFRAPFISAVALPGDLLARLYYAKHAPDLQNKPGTVSNDYAFFGVPGDYSGDVMEDWVTEDTFAGSGGLSTADLVDGPFGLALDLAGSGYLLITGIDIPSLTSACSVGMILNPSVDSGDGTATLRQLFAIDTNNGDNEAIAAVWNSTVSGYDGAFYMNNGGSFPPAKWTSTLPASSWALVDSTWDGSTLRTFANGVNEGSVSASTFVNGGWSYTSLGALHNGTRTWPMVLGEFRVSSIDRDADYLAFRHVDDLANSSTFILAEANPPFILHKALEYAADGIPDSLLTGYPKLFSISGDTDIAAECLVGGAVGVYADGADPQGMDVLPLAFGLYDEHCDLAAGDLLLRAKISSLSAVASPGDVIAVLWYRNLSAVPSQQDKAATVSDYSFFGVPGNYNSGADVLEDWLTGTTYPGSGGLSPADLVPGVFGSALDFDGSDDHIDDLPDIVGGLTTVTVEVLVDNASNDSTYNMYVTRENQLEFGRNNSNQAFIALSNNFLSTGETLATGLRGVAARFDGSTREIFVDGSERVSGSWSTTIPSSAGLTIGARSDGAHATTGAIGEVRISPVARSADWLAFAYVDEFDNADTFTLGAEEGGGVILYYLWPGISKNRRRRRRLLF